MKKMFNYLCYSLCSFLPLYLILFCYYFISKNTDKMSIFLILLLISILSLLYIINCKSTDIFVCSKKELSIYTKRLIDFNYIVFILFFINILIIDFNIFEIFIVHIAFVLILYKLNFVFNSIVLKILGYKLYKIRNIRIYSKKELVELEIILSKNKYLQINKISDNIYIELESYNIKRNYCM